MRGSACLKFWLSLVLVLSVSVSTAAGQHERKRVQRAEIEKLEEQWRQAELGDNIAMMDHLLSDNFLGVTAAGQVVTKAQQLDRVRSHEFDLSRFDISDSKVKISGHIAVVTSLAHLEGRVDGKPLSGNFRYTRVYQRVPGDGWKITNFEATRIPGGSGSYGEDVNAPVARSARHHGAAPNFVPASLATPGSPRPLS